MNHGGGGGGGGMMGVVKINRFLGPDSVSLV